MKTEYQIESKEKRFVWINNQPYYKYGNKIYIKGIEYMIIGEWVYKNIK